MTKSAPTLSPEAAKTSPMPKPHVPDIQQAPEQEVDTASSIGQRAVSAIGGGSPQAPPSQFGSMLGQMQGASSRQIGTLRQMQQGYGNQYVGSVIQAKLTVGSPGDVYEQEADRVADRIMRMPEPKNSPSVTISQHVQPMRVQRMCKECEEEDEQVHRKEAGGQTPRVTPGLEARLDATRDGGQPLPESVRSFMEPRFGADFSEVRLHTGGEANTLNQELKAQAFTRQRDIYFGAGKYNPESEEGKRLLVHELTHVVQQGAGNRRAAAPILQRAPKDPSTSNQPVSKGEKESESPSSFNVRFITDEEFHEQTGLSADVMPEMPSSEQAFMALTGLPPETFPPSLLGADPFAESEPKGVPEVGTAPAVTNAEEVIPNQVIWPQALGIPAILSRYPTYVIPPNATGIMWTQLGAGHLSEFANVGGKLTIRGFRGTIPQHLWGTLFPDALSQGIPGALRNDMLYTRMANQTIVYRASNAQAAARFAETLVSEIPNYNQPYRFPPRAGSGVTVCGNNCINAPASLVSEALGVRPEIITPRGPVDVTKFGGPKGGPYERLQAGRGATMRDWLNQPDRYFEERGLTRVRAPRTVSYIKVGGGILMVYGTYSSGRRIVEAYGTEEFIPVVVEETGALGMGAAGAAVGAKACSWAGPWALVCGVGGGLIGGFLGSKLGRNLGEGIALLLRLPELLGQFAVGTAEALEAVGNYGSAVMEGIFVSPVVETFASLRAGNWDLRYVPPSMEKEFSLLQEVFSAHFRPSTLDEMLVLLVEKPTMGDYELPTGLMERFASKMTQIDLESDPLSPGFTAQELTAMSPANFVKFLTEWNLHFVQNPEYIAGYSGVWDSPFALRFNIHPLIAKRATINPHNWDLSHVSEIEIFDERSGETTTKYPERDILTMGQIVWEHLGGLDQDAFREDSYRPMSNYPIPHDLIVDVAAELEYFANKAYSSGIFGLSLGLPPAELQKNLAQMPPDVFVQFMLDYGVPLRFIKAPSAVAETALTWVRAGYQPW